MADTQPVVLNSLKLPPDQQTFFRIKDIPMTFLHKLNHLNLVLRASHETTPCPQAIELVCNLRKAAVDQCDRIFGVVFHSRNFTLYWLQLVGSLSETPLTDKALGRIHFTTWWTDFIANEASKAHEAMVKFGQDITAAARQFSAALAEGRDTALNATFTTENTRLVTDLLSAVNECETLFLQVIDYFREVERRLQDINFLKSNPPSEEEIEIVRQRWIEFWDSLVGATSDIGWPLSWMLWDPLVKRMVGSRDSSSTTPADVASLNTQNPATAGWEATMVATGTSDATAQPAQDRDSFLRSLLRRSISCFSLKHFC